MNNNNLTIFFDLDDTLITSEGNDIKPRPFLKDLFKFVFENFKNVGIWTAAHESWFNIVNDRYLQPLIDTINLETRSNYKFYSVFTNIDCEMVEVEDYYKIRKPLQKLWYSSLYTCNKHNTVIVDDLEETFSSNIENGILIKKFDFDNDNDTELLKLISTLDQLLRHFQIHKTVYNFN